MDMLLDEATQNELLLCLNGAVYCMIHDVSKETQEFELRRITAMIEAINTWKKV